VKSDARRRISNPELLALAIAALTSCHGGDAQVDCSPTLTCSLRDARFSPAAKIDAGPPACDADRCTARKIAAGRTHTCAIAQAGELVCWGDDSDGQLGRSVLDDAGQAFDAGAEGIVPMIERAKEVTAGGAHSCTIGFDDKLYCWGRNADGEVDGRPSPAPTRAPVQVAIDTATNVAAGDAHTCAVVRYGVVCWGSARFGQSGRKVVDGGIAPGLVPGTEGAVEVTAGVRHTCARLQDGRVLCWGEQIDARSGKPKPGAEPVAVTDLEDATAISAGSGHTCALREGGAVVCWGANDSGQLGDGTRKSSAKPVNVMGLELSLDVSAGGTEKNGRLVGHSCALTKSFFVQCWGRNAEGQLGIGRAPDSPTATVVLGESGEGGDEPFLPDVTAISLGGLHSCAVDHDGPVRCWGDDTRRQLGQDEGNTPNFGRPVEVHRFGGHR
jgi:alpha-tubulin suppressor-like RCC1 family protein